MIRSAAAVLERGVHHDNEHALVHSHVSIGNHVAEIERGHQRNRTLPGFFFNSWFAMLAPAGTPKDMIARLNAEVLKALGDGEVRRKLEELGFAVRGSSAEELRSMTRDQLAKYARVIKQMGIANE